MTGWRSGHYAGAAAIGAIVVLLIAAIAFGQPIARFSAVQAARAAGFDLSYGRLVIHRDALHGENIVVRSRAGEPIATIARVDVGYSLRDLLPGSAHQFGLTSFDVERPAITLIRHKDGSWNIPTGSSQSNAPSSTPFAYSGRIRDGSVEVYDSAQGVVAARHLRARDINADMAVATNAKTTYAGHLTYEEDGTPYDVDGRGTIDVASGYADQRWVAPHLPIARIVDFGLNSPSLHLASGTLDGLDARIVGLHDRDGTLHEHPALTAYLRDGRLAIGGMPKPLRDLHGPLALYGDGLILHTLHATLADAPVSLGGSIYNLVSPRLALTVDAHGPLERLRQTLAQTNTLPLRGDARLHVRVEGNASKPLTLIAMEIPHATYRDVPFERVRGVIAFDGQEADIARFGVVYAGMNVAARGRLALGPRQNALQVVATLDTPPDAIPYARAFVPNMPVHATIVSTGNTLAQADTRGVLGGTNGSRTLLGTFDVRSDGVGTLGPLRIHDRDGSLYAIASVDHPHDRASAFVDATHARFDTRRTRELPGLRIPLLPPADGTLDGRVVATIHRSVLDTSGFATISDLDTAYGRVARTSIRFATDRHETTSVALDANGIGKLGALASAAFAYHNGNVTVRDASLEAGPNVADARGSIDRVGQPTQAYDVAARIHSADLTSLAALAMPSRANLVEGSADADVRVRGSGSVPAIAGNVDSHEGAVNGLAFSGASASLDGTPASLAIADGRVAVDTTRVAFSGTAGSSGGRVAVRAPHADLADFNDFFDAGDMLGGTGSVIADAAFGSAGLAATNGRVALRNARVRNVQFGTTTAAWAGTASHIGGDVAFAGLHGRASAHGVVATTGAMNVTARARGFDLATWLPMAGIVAPVTGIADAEMTARGTYPALDARIHAHVARASVARVPVRSADARVALNDGRGRLSSFALDVPNARVTGGGTFGLRMSDPMNLAFDARTASLHALAHTLGAGTFDADGAVTTHALVTGSMRAPRLDDRIALQHGRYRKFVIPHAAAALHLDRSTLALQSSRIDLARGYVDARARVPISLAPFAIDPRNRPVSAHVVASDVEAGDFAPLMPATTHVTGRVDGAVDVRGTVHAPRFGGALTLANASYSGPAERVPITNGRATLALSGTTLLLRNAHADAGGGTIDADGRASVPSVHDLSAVAFDLHAQAQHTFLDLPQYAKGRFDADVHASRSAGSRPQLSGTLAMRNARIPVTALYNPNAANAPQAPRPDLGLNLEVLADRDVRVVSPNVDVGATGFVNVGGSLNAPQLDGNFTSSGGTVSFYRTLRIERGTVSFSPEGGLIPNVDAVASTSIADPATDIVMHVSGPATGMNLDFASSPSYDREQILALLVDGGGGGMHQNAVAQLASGEVNTLFTRSVLEPFSAELGEGLGLQNLQITNDLQGGLGINAVKGLGKNLNAVYADTFGLPRRESLSLQTRYESAIQYAFTMFNTQGGSLVGMEQPVLVNALSIGNPANLSQSNGNGFDFEVKRTYP